MRTVTREALQERMARPGLAIVEALPSEYYSQGHLPGAVNVPHDQVDDLASDLLPDKAQDIIVYCADDKCPNSSIAAQRLSELGYDNVLVYETGKRDWESAGLPLETSGSEAVSG